MTNPVSPQKSP